jgi:prephenate dehydrogenase
VTRKVLIIGLGLIGGSVALSLQKAPQTKVYGYDVNEKTRALANQLNIVHEIVEDPALVAHKMDFIIFGTPVNATIAWMDEVLKWQLKPTVIVTDTGSTKALIMEKAQQLKAQQITFIGGHPMAGSHKSGVTAAKPHLFENAYYMVTPFQDELEENIVKLEALLKYTHGKLIRVDAKEHDHMTAVVSHFPHIVAASLVHQLDSERSAQPLTAQLAAGGFRDITRIASSNAQLWRDITLQNRTELIDQLQKWSEEMQKVQAILESGDAEQMEAYFEQARIVRDDLPISAGAFYMPFDLYVDIPDYPGVISEITKYLAEDHISITNLRIVEAREDVFGILVISFQSNEDRERAVKCIQYNTQFETYIS